MTSPSTFEDKISQQCNLILNTDNEFWEIRNKAVLQLTILVMNHDPYVN